MKFATELIGGTLVKRYRRFLVDVQLDRGPIVTAHCPNPGTMLGCCEPGQPVLLSESNDIHRRNAYTWELIHMNNSWVGVNVSLPRKIVTEGIQAKLIPSLAQYNELLLDAEYGRNNKIDIMMHGNDRNTFAQIYHVAWADRRVAKFPETPNMRARKALRELTEIAVQGHRAIAFFFIQREDCDAFSPATHIDPEFARLFKEAIRRGVEIMAYRGVVTPEEISLGVPISCVAD